MIVVAFAIICILAVNASKLISDQLATYKKIIESFRYNGASIGITF